MGCCGSKPGPEEMKQVVPKVIKKEKATPVAEAPKVFTENEKKAL